MTERGWPPFRPSPWLPGRDLQTIFPSVAPLPPLAEAAERWFVPVADGTRVRLDVNHPTGPPRATLLLIHGMGGSSDSHYVRSAACSGLERGWVVLRMNLRNCGGTESHSRTLYNAGQSDDVAAVCDALATQPATSFPRPWLAAGFSLGGNILLRYAGRAGTEAAPDRFAAINPPVDLARCLAELERTRNRLYQAHYTLKLCRQLARIRRLRGLPGPRPTFRTVRHLRRLDGLYTAPDAGYPSAEAYYRDASAGPVLSGIRRPTLILSAANDPIVPPTTFDAHRGTRGIRFHHPRHGGHCGYRQREHPRDWSAGAVIGWFDQAG